MIESSGGPYVGYDYIEYDGTIYITGSAVYVLVNVGYTYGGQSYQLISGSGSVVVSSVNSTAIEYYIQGVGTWEITVDSNQFLSPSSTETFQVSMTAIAGTAQNTTSSTLESC